MTDPHERLAAASKDLGAEELEVLVLIAERLVMGQSYYGLLRLQDDARDFDQEAVEECADGLVYAACSIIKRRQGGQ